MKRLVVLALVFGLGFALLEKPLAPAFGQLFRRVADITFFVLFFGTKVEFLPNGDLASQSHWDSNAIVHGKGEVFGFVCDSGLAYQALSVFLALWAATPLRGRRLATLRRGLAFVFLFLVGRLGLMVLEVLANHDCLTPGSHWAIARLPWVGSALTFLNWEIAMDLVVALFGPFVIWALVCGREIFSALGLVGGPRVRPAGTLPNAAILAPGSSPSLAGFDPFQPGSLRVVAEATGEDPGDGTCAGAGPDEAPEVADDE